MIDIIDLYDYFVLYAICMLLQWSKGRLLPINL